jgi:hypothetical protein
MVYNTHMITEKDILEVLPHIHPVALEMILSAEPETWEDVEMALAWIGYSVELSMRKVQKRNR